MAVNFSIPQNPLSKIKQLTTQTGIYQFGNLDEPAPEFGYALDDQARALIVAHHLKAKDLEKIYLNFILNAKGKDGLLHQFYYEDSRGFIDKTAEITVLVKQEVFGSTLWGLIFTGNFREERLKELVDNLKENARSWISPRAIAAALLGLTKLPKQTLIEKELIEKMHSFFKNTSTPTWPWFENYLTYANPILPWSCWEVALERKDDYSLQIAEKSTLFLIETSQIGGVPAPIGNQGWFKKDGQRALYDQQPIDAAYMVCCLEKAYQVTRNQLYLAWAKKWWQWFFGNNLNKIPLIDENFACYDGLTPNGANKNQGAESNICFLLAYLAAKRLKL